MKKIVFLIILFSLFINSIDGLGQNLRPKTGQNGKYGFVDNTGKEMTPFKYDWVYEFSEGLGRVQLNDKYGFVDKTGKEVIPLEYDFARKFSEGLAAVKLNGKWGFIDKKGKEVIPFIYSNANVVFNEGRARVQLRLHGKWEYIKNPLKNRFSVFAQEYVEPKINEWQKKGEFEKIADWQNRVNEITRNEKVATLTKEAEQLYIEQLSEKINMNQNVKLKEYDADKEVYLVESKRFGYLFVPVPIDKAPDFKTNWDSLDFHPKYFIENDVLALAELTFALPDNQSFKYSNQASLNYTPANVDYNFEPLPN
jgi:hypothetical protein